MAAEAGTHDLIKVVTLLGAAVVMVPLFRRLGLGSVLGYLCAGLIIGPFGLKLFVDPSAILHVAELGVVMFLFVIGLEMRPSHLWSLRGEIFGLGSLQIFVCSSVIVLLGIFSGFSPMVSFIGGVGFVLTSTAIVMQLLGERGDIALPHGQKMVSILLFEDLLIVPLLAFVAFMSPQPMDAVSGSQWMTIAIGIGSIVAVIVAGVWLLNPLFRILAFAKAREVMTAAALLVVLGTALLMQLGGLSMAMGAFLAGVLLAESTFRHQIEADIEPFRGILLGLFFIGVGMSLDLAVVGQNWSLILICVLVLMATKSFCIFIVAKIMGSNNREAIDRGVLMAQGGEFAFVLFTAAVVSGLIDSATSANLTAIVILSMALTPLEVIAFKTFMPKISPSLTDVDEANGLEGSVLIVGFGRFGQVTSQLLLARQVDVTIIDSDADRIRNASKFGFKIYYGDGSRLDVLRASGAHIARAIAVCVDDKVTCTRIVELIKSQFPQAKILARSFDRIHARELLKSGADFQIRETFESAILFGEAALREIGIDPIEVQEISQEIRRRDKERFQLEVAEDRIEAGRSLLLGNMPKRESLIAPLVSPQAPSLNLSPETAEACKEKSPDSPN